MVGIFKSLFAFLALFLAFVAAAPTTTTNAARFKQGLGPLKPKNLFTTIGGGNFGTTQDPSGATVIQTQLASLQPGNLDFVSPPYGGYPKLGFSSVSSSIGPGAPDVCYLVGSVGVSKHSPAVSTPDQSFTNGSQSEPTESAVWYLVDVATLEIAPQWVNSNGGLPTTYLAYFTALGYFFATGDPGTVASVFSPYGNNIPIRFNLDTVNVPA
ncbi:hypothetical protein M407DRAFT_8380 [Tulasnella calospora MUT 4182]|uniref:Uncharacterized protein n=1 Tax=Tulasnella calospora MUT 4182 TaxID=1051891 RepID=A0A0C3KVJ9_9AGAM|nr:hypothetical protein M407DRAFT_8380 [Tulasnella calospora MUT 4182]